MIKSIEIDGYKNLTNYKINLKDVNYLTGENGAGKSNFLEALQFIQNLVKMNLRSCFNHVKRGELGNDCFTLLPNNEYGSEIKFKVINDKFEYQITIKRIKNKFGFYYPIITNEQLINLKTSKAIFKTVDNKLIYKGKEYCLDKFESSFLVKINNKLKQEILGWSFFENTLYSLPLRLAKVKKQDKYNMTIISNIINDFFPNFIEVDINEESKIIITDNNGLVLSLLVIPHSVLKLLSLVCYLFDKKTTLLCVDNIECSLHPSLMGKLEGLLKEMTSQVIVTHHSYKLPSTVNF